MSTYCRLVVLPLLIATAVITFSSPARGQGGSGQATQYPARVRKPPQKENELGPYLPREASIRLPQRYEVRGGIEASAPSHLSKGETEYRAGRNAAAVPELRQAVKESPDSYDSHYLLALTLTETGDLKGAIAEFTKAIALATKDDSKIVANYNMANAYFDLGDYQNAADTYKIALQIDNTLSKVHNNLGLALAAQKRLTDAAAEFRRATELKSQYAEARYNLGVTYFKLGQREQAQEQQQVLANLKSELADKLNLLLTSTSP
jgi:Tfp pilus assembly protein PilF